VLLPDRRLLQEQQVQRQVPVQRVQQVLPPVQQRVPELQT
jgi:hypothetical protein